MSPPSGSCRGRRTPLRAAAACRSTPRSLDLEDHRVALPAAGADRRTAETAAATAQLQSEASEDPRPGRADRVPEGDGTAVDVDAVLVDAEHANRVERHRGESLVDL